MSMDTTSTGARIREARIAAGLTKLRDLSNLLDVAESRVSEWENGHAVPRAEMIVKIAKACGCTTDQLLGHEAA